MPSPAGSLDNLPATVPPHFQEAQHSIANHRKNIVSLCRIHLKASTVVQGTSKGTRPIGEKAFNQAFFDCFDRVLPIKKGVTNADRVCKFVAAYATYAQEQFSAQARQGRQSQDEEDEEEKETAATRFIDKLIRHLLKGFRAKDRNVRLRCCGSIAFLVNGLDCLDEDLFQLIKKFLLERVKDKESTVRVQAVTALAKFEEEEDVGKELVQALRFDPSPDVRRAALFNLTIKEDTKPFFIERLRDVDATTRRCVYLGSLTTLLQSRAKNNAGGPSRLGLDAESTEEVIRVGMGERDPIVKKAANKLVNAWFDACAGDLVVFLNHFDVIDSPHAEPALLAIFESRPAIAASISFDSEQFWSTLSPSTAMLARATVDYYRRTGNEARLEECLPLVTALAFRIQKEYQELLADPQDQARTFVVKQLLGIAMSSDYGDEIGRRKMFGLVRDMISYQDLPEKLIPSCLDVLLKLSNGQRDFMRMIVEIVAILGEEEEEEEGEMSMDESSNRPKERKSVVQPDAEVQIRRLLIVRSMLERVIGALNENTAFLGLIPQVIAPGVRSTHPVVREQALACLGLCCLLDRDLAFESFQLFMDQSHKGTEAIRLCSVHAIFDLLIVHSVDFLLYRSPEDDRRELTITYLLALLEDDDSSVQSAAGEGMAKLMLTGMVDDDEALKSLVLVYMSPETVDNQELRQCLSYFIPLYCLSSSANQRRLQRVFVWIFQVLAQVYAERTEDEEMVTPTQVGLQLLDWTDPTKLVLPDGDEDVHLDVGIDLLQAIRKTDDRDERKVMAQLLAKLHLPESPDKVKVQMLLKQADKLKRHNPLEESVARNAFVRFETALAKAYPVADADAE